MLKGRVALVTIAVQGIGQSIDTDGDQAYMS
jgi:hypothetical protein